MRFTQSRESGLAGWFCGALLLAVTLSPALAHPHLSKRVKARIGSVWVTASFRTSPASEAYPTEAKKGSFNVGGRLELEGDLAVGEVVLKAGHYVLGAVKDGPKAWTMGVSPRYQGANRDQVIRLDSWFSDQQGYAEHHHFDIRIGSGRNDGKVVLVWHFGSLYLEAPLS